MQTGEPTGPGIRLSRNPGIKCTTSYDHTFEWPTPEEAVAHAERMFAAHKAAYEAYGWNLGKYSNCVVLLNIPPQFPFEFTPCPSS